MKRKEDITKAVNESYKQWVDKNKFKPNIEKFQASPKLKKRLETNSYIDIL